MDQKWLANGTAVLVLDPGSGEPTIGDGHNGQMANPDYRPALVAVLTTEYHEPGQVLDADPLAPVDETGAIAAPTGVTAPVAPAVTPPPQAVPGPATQTVTTRDTAAEDPNVTVPGTPAAVGPLPAARIIATIRELETRAAAGDADAQAELDQLNAAFEADEPADADDADRVPGGTDTTAGAATAADTPETAPGGNGEQPASAPPGSSTTTP